MGCDARLAWSVVGRRSTDFVIAGSDRQWSKGIEDDRSVSDPKEGCQCWEIWIYRAYNSTFNKVYITDILEYI